MSCSAAARPTSTIGVRMLVSAGVWVAPRSVLSTPVIEISSGIRTPFSRHAIMPPTANTSLVETTAVGRFFSASRRRIIAVAAARSIGPYCAQRSSSSRPACGQRGAHAGAALERAVVAVDDGAQQAEAAMAERDQVARHLEGRRAVVEADARMAPQRVDAPGQHVGPAVALEQREQRRVVVQADEHERIDAVADQLLGDRAPRPRGRSDARPAPAHSPSGRAPPASRWWSAHRARSRTTARRRRPSGCGACAARAPRRAARSAAW